MFDKKNGQGTMNWVDKNEIYEGFWEDNKQNGFGRHLWLESTGELKS